MWPQGRERDLPVPDVRQEQDEALAAGRGELLHAVELEVEGEAGERRVAVDQALALADEEPVGVPQQSEPRALGEAPPEVRERRRDGVAIEEQVVQADEVEQTVGPAQPVKRVATPKHQKPRRVPRRRGWIARAASGGAARDRAGRRRGRVPAGRSRRSAARKGAAASVPSRRADEARVEQRQAKVVAPLVEVGDPLGGRRVVGVHRHGARGPAGPGVPHEHLDLEVEVIAGEAQLAGSGERGRRGSRSGCRAGSARSPRAPRGSRTAGRSGSRRARRRPDMSRQPTSSTSGSLAMPGKKRGMSAGRCWPSPSSVISQRAPCAATCSSAVRSAAPLPRRSRVSQHDDVGVGRARRARSPSVLPSSTTTTCATCWRQARATPAAVAALL